VNAGEAEAPTPRACAGLEYSAAAGQFSARRPAFCARCGSVVTPPQQPKALSPLPAAVDDEGLIRESIERFRAVYNGRLGVRNDARVGGPLRFAGCDVAIANGTATATCDDAAEPGNDLEAGVWTFALRHDTTGWAVTSITTR
jgi:hypothetical protein